MYLTGLIKQVIASTHLQKQTSFPIIFVQFSFNFLPRIKALAYLLIKLLKLYTLKGRSITLLVIEHAI